MNFALCDLEAYAIERDSRSKALSYLAKFENRLRHQIRLKKLCSLKDSIED
jgi:hypothetical protein